MSKIKENILKQLKDKVSNEQFGINSSNFLYKKGSNTSFYVRPSYLNNLFLNKEDFYKYKLSFDLGAGHEIKPKPRWGNLCKMQSIGSSSAMIVNLLGLCGLSSYLKIKKNQLGIPQGEYSVQFEKKFKVLMKTNNGKKNFPAHIDAFLLSSDKKTVILIESKMLEYLRDNKIVVSESYLNSENYYNNGNYYVDLFIKLKKLSGLKNLDYPQLIKHIIGFNNAIICPDKSFYIYKTNYKSENFDSVQRIILINVLWRMKNINNPLYNDFIRCWDCEFPIDSVKQDLENHINNSLKNLSKKIQINFIPFDELINIIEYTKERRKYLERYFIQAITTL